MTKEIIIEMLQIFEEEAVKKEKYSKISLDWPQAVLQVRFEKEIPMEQVTMEQANEGEKYGG